MGRGGDASSAGAHLLKLAQRLGAERSGDAQEVRHQEGGVDGAVDAGVVVIGAARHV